MATPTTKKWVEMVEKELERPGVAPERRRELMEALRTYEEMRLSEEMTSPERRTTRMQAAPATSSFNHESATDKYGADPRWREAQDLERERQDRSRYFTPLGPASSERR